MATAAAADQQEDSNNLNPDAYGQENYEQFQKQYRDMITLARGELLGASFGNYFMQVQPGFMRKRRAVQEGGSTTPDQ